MAEGITNPGMDEGAQKILLGQDTRTVKEETRP